MNKNALLINPIPTGSACVEVLKAVVNVTIVILATGKASNTPVGIGIGRIVILNTS